MGKKISQLGIISIILMISISLVSALTYDTIDNDALSSSPGTTSNHGMTYGTGSGNYNNDYRISKTGSSTSYYWNHKSKNYESAGRTSYRVYLNNTKFTCPSAVYSVSYGNLGNLVTRMINQDTAPAGWTYIVSGVRGNEMFYLGATADPADSSGGGYFGADACQMVY